jgi:long-subunit fatty acid transport protein
MVFGSGEYFFTHQGSSMKYYRKAWGAVIALCGFFWIGFLYFWQQANLQKHELEETKEKIAGLNQQLIAEEIRLGELTRDTAPYREFSQVWEEFYHELDIGNIFLILDEMATEYGLATSRKATSKRQEWGHGEQSRQVTVLSVTITGSYRQMMQFLNRLSVRLPLLKADLLNVRPSGMQSVETSLQMSIPWR